MDGCSRFITSFMQSFQSLPSDTIVYLDISFDSISSLNYQYSTSQFSFLSHFPIFAINSAYGVYTWSVVSGNFLYPLPFTKV